MRLKLIFGVAVWVKHVRLSVYSSRLYLGLFSIPCKDDWRVQSLISLESVPLVKHSLIAIMGLIRDLQKVSAKAGGGGVISRVWACQVTSSVCGLNGGRLCRKPL